VWVWLWLVPSAATCWTDCSFSRCFSELLSVALADTSLSFSLSSRVVVVSVVLLTPAETEVGAEVATLGRVFAGASKDGMESISSSRELMSIMVMVAR